MDQIAIPPSARLMHEQNQTALQPACHAVDEIEALLDLPFNDLVHRAQTVHRENFDPNRVQLSTLLSIKTGGCPEDCAY